MSMTNSNGFTGDFFGMPYARYEELQWGTGPAQLSEDEIAQGWHWCLEWDDLLIHPLMSEYASCGCEGCGAFAEKARKREEIMRELVIIDEYIESFTSKTNKIDDPVEYFENMKLEADQNNDDFRNGTIK
jgi:hypothetical protein